MLVGNASQVGRLSTRVSLLDDNLLCHSLTLVGNMKEVRALLVDLAQIGETLTTDWIRRSE
jgi:hypothetical protein